jgi:Type IX secretion system protein PorV
MRIRLAFFGLTLMFGANALSGVAQTGSSSAGTTGTFVTTAVPFLRISPDARAGAMGDAGIAVSPDANAQFWNVGKLPFAEKNFAFSATYTPWLHDLVPDIFLAYLSLYGKFGQNSENVIGASMRYFSLGNINYTDAQGNPNGTGMPREFSFDLGYSRKLSDYLGVGVTGRYINSAIANGVTYSANGGSGQYSPGNAVSADVGLYYTKKTELDGGKAHTWSFGAVASNIGSKISYNSSRKDFIPMNIGIGAAYTVDLDEYNSITGTVDLNKLLVPILSNSDSQVAVVNAIFSSFSTGDQLKEIDASLGAEWWYQKQFGLRAGYFYEDPTNGDRQYFTCGLGVKYNVFQLNASYLVPQGNGITRNPLSNTLRFSLMFEFDKMPKAAPEKDTEPITTTPVTE